LRVPELRPGGELSGLVTVNGQTVTELGSKADASRDHIKVSGKLLRPAKELIYVLLHKPAAMVSTMEDPEGRSSLRDLLDGISERVFPVGRLEYNASGLLLLTNDGDLANRILQSHHLPQTYQLKIKGRLTPTEMEDLSRATGARIERLRGGGAPWYEATLSEARRDALRNKLFQSDHPVEKMKRVRLAGIGLGTLPPGAHRPLSGAELAALKRLLQRSENPEERPPLSPGRTPETRRRRRVRWRRRRAS
jgi:23S rRNA pseudouridine2605 synthase